MKQYKVLTINPGSTSTKVALFEGEKTLFSKNVAHDAAALAKFKEVSDQREYRKQMVLDAIAESGASMDGLDAVVGRGGGLMAVEGGVYAVGDILFDHAVRGANGVQHPAQLGPQLAREFAERYHCPALVVNPPDTDEFQPVSRITGLKDVYRTSHLHALNLKETAIRHAAGMGRRYEDCNFVVCHIGGGLSVSAHQKGRMIDGNDIVGGSGPMAPTRCGEIPAVEMIRYCFSGKTEKEAMALCMKTGGFMSLLGTADAIEVTKRAEAGDKKAALVWDAMIYQTVKAIGAMAAALHGQVDGILLGGGMVHSKDLVEKITEGCAWIAPVTAYPGEFEMEAMAAGAARALSGEEPIKEYTGKHNWSPADFE